MGRQARMTSEAIDESTDEINLGSFNAAVAHHRASNSEFAERELEKQELARHLLQIMGESTDEAEDTEVDAMGADVTQVETVFQRKGVKLYAKGDPVDIYSSKNEQWVD